MKHGLPWAGLAHAISAPAGRVFSSPRRPAAALPMIARHGSQDRSGGAIGWRWGDEPPATVAGASGSFRRL
jgi:hypothetical protein